ncbi:hypothetical protein DFH07DRAFT_776978 [Mycena maculata]|uniref:Uncharacterized protein n=1 Tax=Mycena maculata TaxID=230809 RepID=A0AAD7IJS0_9AGAR|nr:hypothetical protein DFH07DRAFT_776978 [Mycena maculata]
MEYFQLGGFNASIQSHPRYTLAPKVYEVLLKHQHPDEPDPKHTVLNLDLVLGIKYSGTAHLLITPEEYRAIYAEVWPAEERSRANFSKQHFTTVDDRRKAWNELQQTFLQWNPTRLLAMDFDSVSPIAFADLRALDTRPETLCPAKRGAFDNSPVNKVYRGVVDSSSVLYRVLQNQIDRRKLDLCDTSWSISLCVFSFAYNLWATDERSAADRRRFPKFLDIGWCEAVTPTLQGDMKMEKYIMLDKYDGLGNFGQGDLYEYGEKEVCSREVAGEQIEAIFGKYTCSTPHPALLLVHNVETAMDVLKSLGVDVTQWEFNLKNLLRTQSTPRGRTLDPRLHAPRSRSASPRHGAPAHPTSPPAKCHAPIYVVDIKSLFEALVGMHPNAVSIPRICRHLQMPQPKSWMMVEVFRRMAAGSAIVEQAVEWARSQPQFQGSGLDGDFSDYGEEDE